MKTSFNILFEKLLKKINLPNNNKIKYSPLRHYSSWILMPNIIRDEGKLLILTENFHSKVFSTSKLIVLC